MFTSKSCISENDCMHENINTNDCSLHAGGQCCRVLIVWFCKEEHLDSLRFCRTKRLKGANGSEPATLVLFPEVKTHKEEPECL